ncbi:hypothetical protein JOE59_000054 [Agromyces cerinus]|uniref:DEAD/DEAH box helicase n=1 Tax=Agromyces cerinus TaxID=33878 RepID=UPI0019566738|nr:DEAD/DEAH box helicase [Agromyces cerinus]MBM7829349.1 hypothetical protein [Agromyces cerinus]
MNRDELRHFRNTRDDLAAWCALADAVSTHREAVAREAQLTADALRSRIVEATLQGAQRCAVLTLRASDIGLLEALTRFVALPTMSDEERMWIDRLRLDVPPSLRAAKTVTGLRRSFSGERAKKAGQDAAHHLDAFHAWGHQVGLPAVLSRVDDRDRKHQAPSIAEALSDGVGLREVLLTRGTPASVPPQAFASLRTAIAGIDSAIQREQTLRRKALDAGVALRRTEADRLIAEMPVERIKEATRERVRVAPLADAGIRTVRDVFLAGDRLQHLPGIGVTTATRIRGAAQTIWEATLEEVPVRINPAERTAEASALIRSIAEWDVSRTTMKAADDLARAEGLRRLAGVLDAGVESVVVIENEAGSAQLLESVDAVVRRAHMIAGAYRAATLDPWTDFTARPADYFAMMSDLGFLLENEESVAGDLPHEIVEAVRAVELDTGLLTASLRGYQSFGARFALVQKKVIIGDEMGLGKTVEALAVVCHLQAKGARYHLVICPAAVVSNWVREIESKSMVPAHRLHGSGRETAARSWIARGGIAVTTFESLAWLEHRLASIEELASVVIDEAHYIKNPGAQRSRRSAAIVGRATRAILLTGTPLENRVDEFRTLVDYVRPDLTVDAEGLRPRLFRQQVAPAYLRRRQEDVLTELPELVEVEEWLTMSDADELSYRSAVFARNFQAMRQAAMVRGPESTKVQRLLDIVAEAEENGRKVIVFSNFREVLQQVAGALPGVVFGPLTGSVPAAKRQMMVDEFSQSGDGAVLVSQIIAGGVGLNIQAASVVVICEPQLKPTIEWQAIARARRMGQLNSVQVHRLLSDEGVDVRVMQILEKKTAIFDDFAAVSDSAQSAPEAVDVSELELVKEVVEEERRRLFPDRSHESETVVA